MAKKVIRQDSEIAMGGLSEEEFVSASQQNEGFGKDESIIPFTRIMQPLSPQVGMIAGATPGVFLNLATNSVYQNLLVAPIIHQYNYTEWLPRDSGGGFIKDWGEDRAGWQAKCEPNQKEAYQPVTKDNHSILIARHFMILQLQGDDPELSIFPFYGTMLKVARAWSSALQYAQKIPTSQGLMTPAYYYYVYQITLDEVKNAKGRWFLPKITPVMNNGKQKSLLEFPNGRELWNACKKYRESLITGEMKVASQDQEGEGDTY